MRILMITRDFPPREGGGGSHAYGIARGLSVLGHTVVVLAPPWKGDGEFDCRQHFPVRRVPGGNIRILRVIPSLFLAIWILRRYQIERLFLITWPTFGPIGLLFRFLFHVPYCILSFGADTIVSAKTRWQRRIRLLTLAHMNRAFANSHFTAQRLAQLRVDASKICVIPPGTDYGDVDLDADIQDILEKHRISGKRVILTISRLTVHKGHDMVIRALPKVLQGIPNTVYMIIGRGSEAENLQELVESLNLKEHVLFAGFVPDDHLHKYYLACDLFVMVSREIQEIGSVEGFGIVFLEANACLKPVIGSRAGGISDAVIDGVTGLLVDPLNPDEIADAIIRILSDGDLASRMGRSGRARVVAEFGWDTICRQIERELQRS